MFTCPPILGRATSPWESHTYMPVSYTHLDVYKRQGKEFVEQLEAKMKEIGVGEIGVISGRYYAMDRDNRWDRVELAYNALTSGEGVKGTDAPAAVQASYDNDKTCLLYTSRCV